MTAVVVSLVFLTFYIFLYAVSISDNTVAVGILWIVMFAESVEVLVVGTFLVSIFFSLGLMSLQVHS